MFKFVIGLTICKLGDGNVATTIEVNKSSVCGSVCGSVCSKNGTSKTKRSVAYAVAYALSGFFRDLQPRQMDEKAQ